MLLRVFGYIWGSLLLTMLLFVGLVSGLDMSAPEGAMRRMDRELMQRDLVFLAQTDSVAAAQSHWQRVAAQHPDLAVRFLDACSSDTAETCIQVTYASAGNAAVDAVPFLLPLLVGAAVSALGAIALSQWLTRPLRTVSSALQQLSEGQLNTRIRDRLQTGTGEVARLAASFDHAAERLQELTESRQRLFHDVSHEIRSPLARLMAAVALLELRPERLPEMQQKMETDITRLDQLVDGILTLARFEAYQTEPEVEALDLADILEPILSDATFEGEQRGIRVAYDGPDSLPMNGHAEMLHRAFENVVRNALAYSPDHGTIAVWCRATERSLVVEVRDSGPGVAEGELSSLFQPFVRGANATTGQGMGLGLAIAATAVSFHGGRIEALNASPTGLVIRVTLPASA